MTTLYLESSAVLAWLFDEPAGKHVADLMSEASTLAASILTEIEVERVLCHALAAKRRTETEALKLRGMLNREKPHWDVVGLVGEVVERARRPFPLEPVRSLDAIHLATALDLLTAYPDLQVLTLDVRLADNARALGLPVLS
ncbi:MAG TPA: type II toxin-antitoxin system VapC family toxin [Candidatus Polarisedimenticolaceae bacterium]|nr:type II toxin-antitoxin system VapC family toxin [Candidatus Polarisedimenticolaceae bacterium]